METMTQVRGVWVSQRTVGLGLGQVGWCSGGFLEAVSPEGRVEGLGWLWEEASGPTTGWSVDMTERGEAQWGWDQRGREVLASVP